MSYAWFESGVDYPFKNLRLNMESRLLTCYIQGTRLVTFKVVHDIFFFSLREVAVAMDMKTITCEAGKIMVEDWIEGNADRVAIRPLGWGI